MYILCKAIWLQWPCLPMGQFVNCFCIMMSHLCGCFHWRWNSFSKNIHCELKKGCHPNHGYNFVNCWLICKILSLLQRALNFKQNHKWISESMRFILEDKLLNVSSASRACCDHERIHARLSLQSVNEVSTCASHKSSHKSFRSSLKSLQASRKS